jgi:hypothetical protein
MDVMRALDASIPLTERCLRGCGEPGKEKVPEFSSILTEKEWPNSIARGR